MAIKSVKLQGIPEKELKATLVCWLTCANDCISNNSDAPSHGVRYVSVSDQLSNGCVLCMFLCLFRRMN